MATTAILGMKDKLAKAGELLDKLLAEMQEKGVQEPTFDADSTDDYQKLAPKTFATREMLIDELQDLIWLVQGPQQSVLFANSVAVSDLTVMNILNHFNVWNAVPLDGDASYEEIAAKVRLPVDAISRILDHAVTLRLFAHVDPTNPTRVKHTSRTAPMVRDPDSMSVIATTLDSNGPPVLALARALDKWAVGEAKLPTETGKLGFNLAYSGGLWGKYDTLWDLIENDGEGERKGWRQGEMVGTMRFVKKTLDLDAVLVKATDWATPAGAHIVDVGGSAGHDDIVLANAFPDVSITVQDLPKCAPDFETTVSQDLRDRVSFQAYDFFTPQPVSADFYLFKYIFYDWPEAYARRIVSSLIPALKPGARIVVLEYVRTQLPPGLVLPNGIKRGMTSVDVRMMGMFGHSERTVEDVVNLWTGTDERFEVVKADGTSRPPVLLLELKWRG